MKEPRHGGWTQRRWISAFGVGVQRVLRGVTPAGLAPTREIVARVKQAVALEQVVHDAGIDEAVSVADVPHRHEVRAALRPREIVGNLPEVRENARASMLRQYRRAGY